MSTVECHQWKMSRFQLVSAGSFPTISPPDAVVVSEDLVLIGPFVEAFPPHPVVLTWKVVTLGWRAWICMEENSIQRLRIFVKLFSVWYACMIFGNGHSKVLIESTQSILQFGSNIRHNIMIIVLTGPLPQVSYLPPYDRLYKGNSRLCLHL